MKKIILLTGLAGAIIASSARMAAAQDAAPAAPATNAANNNTDTAAQTQADDQTPQPVAQGEPAAPAAATPPATTTQTTTQTTVAPTTVATTTTTTAVPNGPVLLPNGEKGLRMNFSNVPLDQVLHYMSDAAGFIVHAKPGVEITGRVSLYAAQPVGTNQAVILLKQMLNENGYTVIQDGGELTVVRTMEANRSNPGVYRGEDPASIAKNDSDYRTQIVSVHSLNVIQLVKELEALKPTSITIGADEAANSIMLTGPANDIRHLMEIVTALDSVNSGNATVRVWALRYADAKALASLIKELFPDTSTSGAGGGRNAFGRFGRGGGGGGGFPFAGFGGGPGGGGGDTSDSNGHTPTAKVVATSDDHSNSLIVSAPDVLIDTIDQLVKSLDTAVEDSTEIRIFALKHADPTETANEITSLFSPDTSSTDASRGPVSFFGRGFGGFGGGGNRGNNTANAESDRMKKMAAVTAVADPRTSSVVVTAGKDTMLGIAAMVEQLDASEAGTVRATVIPLANADPIDVQNILQQLFTTSSGRSANSANSSQLNYMQNRATTLLQQQNNNSGNAFGSSGVGGGSGGRTGFGN